VQFPALATPGWIAGACEPTRRTLASPLSVSFWFSNTLTTDAYIIAQDARAGAVEHCGWSIILNGNAQANGMLRFMQWSNNTQRTEVVDNAGINTFRNAAWHHAVICYDGPDSTIGRYRWVVDGVSRTLAQWSNTAQQASIAPVGTKLCLGCCNDNGGAGFGIGGPVKLDEVSIYSVGLTVAQAQAIYNGGSPKDLRTLPTVSSMLGWWRCGDSDAWPSFFDWSLRGSGLIARGTMAPANIIAGKS
jgi:hypothetical protein